MTEQDQIEHSPASAYPLHDKLRASQGVAMALSGFLDMLDELGLHLAMYHEHSPECFRDEEGKARCYLRKDTLYDIRVPTKEQLIGEYLQIDPKALSREKDAMYAELIAANAKR